MLCEIWSVVVFVSFRKLFQVNPVAGPNVDYTQIYGQLMAQMQDKAQIQMQQFLKSLQLKAGVYFFDVTIK